MITVGCTLYSLEQVRTYSGVSSPTGKALSALLSLTLLFLARRHLFTQAE